MSIVWVGAGMESGALVRRQSIKPGVSACSRGCIKLLAAILEEWKPSQEKKSVFCKTARSKLALSTARVR